MNAEEGKDRNELTLESILEGKKLDAYAEHCTKKMHVCALCGAVGYLKKPMKQIGEKWVCIDCIRELKEVLDTLPHWESEVKIGKEMSKKVDDMLDV